MEGHHRDRDSHGHKSKHHHHHHRERDRDRERERHHRHHHRHRRDSRESSQEEFPTPPPPPPPPPHPSQKPLPGAPGFLQPAPPVKEKNFKLIVDPCLVKGAPKKIYRVDGIVPSEPSWSVVSVKDPRPMIPRRWSRPDIIDLPVPRFKIDSNYVGEPPELEITITNLNDNIDKAFLTDLVSKHGDLEEVTIFYHPVTRKHTGIARVVFTEVSYALTCVGALHNRSVMGKSLVAFIDPLGKEWQRMVQKITMPDVEKEEDEPIKEVKKDPTPAPIPSVQPDSGANGKFDEVAKSDNKGVSMQGVGMQAIPAEPSPQMFSVPPPPFHRPPPMALPPMAPPPGAGAPQWPPPREWVESGGPWNQPPPVPPCGPPQTQWVPSPQFMSPPPSLPSQPQPPPPAEENPLDLDTRIALLLKGGINGMAPPFLSLDDEPPKEEVQKKAPPRSASVSSEEEPLPPGVDASPSYSPTAPIPSLCEHSSDKYLPLSTPPSPFLSEEEYLESLLKWRIRHLSFVQQEEVEQRRKNKLIPDKVEEISSDEDETVFVKQDDQMSLSSLSSVNETIEEVAIPSNPYGSYHSEEGASYTQFHPHQPPPPVPHPHGLWPPFYPGQPTHLYPPPFGLDAGHPPPFPNNHFDLYDTTPAEESVFDGDVLSQTVDLALDRVCELMSATIERDIMKKMTEVLAFNEFEKWWETEERKYYEQKEPDKEKESTKEEPEEKKSTTDALLNSLIDSNFDSLASGFTLGFRAALPKMPSFRRKQIEPSPGRADTPRFDKDKRNESDEEEMVQLSDSESQETQESFSSSRKKRMESDSSSSESSESTDSSESESDDSDTESVASGDQDMKASLDEFLMLVDDEKLEEMRSKTPEDRLTPIPSEDFSDIDRSDDGSSRSSSPSGSRDLKKYAMEALAALGLDEFVESVKIREKEKVPKPEVTPKAPKLPSLPKKSEQATRPKAAVNEEKMKDEEKPIEEPVKVEEEAEEGEIMGAIPEGTEVVDAKPPFADLITVEHSYSKPEGAKEEPVERKPMVDSWILDHDYSGPKPAAVVPVKNDNAAVKSTTKERKKKSEKLVSHLLDSYLKKEARPSKTYTARDPLKEMMTCYEFLTKGVDQEDINYFKKAFEVILADETQSYWLSNMHWASHPATDVSRQPVKRHKSHHHQSGCARTQGFYKLDPVEKQRLKHHYGRNKLTESQQAATDAKVWMSAGREARSNQRRLLTAFGADTDSDLLKFNQLKFRKKLLMFGKSEIHDWGLFAKEPIAADEMVIEYVGQKVRPFLADYREIKYQKRGIGSSYLFRIDLEHIVDATTCGNLARFINHSCNPNCYAKIITIESEKKIVIYSKRDIKVDEEITYDYKFPLEEEKIACLCGDAQCKGFLN